MGSAMELEARKRAALDTYSKEQPNFRDPIVRCTNCRKLVPRDYIMQHGACACGCRKITEARSLTMKEFEGVKLAWPDFALIFEEAGEDPRIGSEGEEL